MDVDYRCAQDDRISPNFATTDSCLPGRRRETADRNVCPTGIEKWERGPKKTPDADSRPGRPHAKARIDPRRRGRVLRPAASRALNAAGAAATHRRSERRGSRARPRIGPLGAKSEKNLAWEAVGRTRRGPHVVLGHVRLSLPGHVAAGAGDADVPAGHRDNRYTLGRGVERHPRRGAIGGPMAAGSARAPARCCWAIGGVIGFAWLAATAIYGVTILREGGRRPARDHRGLAQPVRAGRHSGVLYAAAALGAGRRARLLWRGHVGRQGGNSQERGVFSLAFSVLFPPFLLFRDRRRLRPSTSFRPPSGGRWTHGPGELGDCSICV